MADSAHTLSIAKDRDQHGVLGKLRSVRVTVTFGSDYAAAVLPRITARSLGLAEVIAVIPQGVTNVGSGAAPAITTGGGDFTLKLWDGTTAVGTTNQSATTLTLLVIGV